MNPNLHYWLTKQPRPVAVLADDKRIEVSNNARGWKDLTATVKALEPSKLTALGKGDSVLRSITLEAEDEAQPSAAVPPSPEMSDLKFFGQLLADAHDKGGKALLPVIESAMKFVENQTVRLEKADGEIDRLRAIVHRQHLQIVELSNRPAVGDSDETGGVVGALLAGIAQGQAANIVPAINGSNGKGANKS